MEDGYDDIEPERQHLNSYHEEQEEGEEEQEKMMIKEKLLAPNHVQEQTTIQRVRKKAARQATHLNHHHHAVATPSPSSYRPHAVPLSSKRVPSQRRVVTHCRDSLSDWINNHNAAYNQVMSQACIDGQITGDIVGEPSLKKQEAGCLAKQIQNFRQRFTHSDLEGLERAAIVEAAHCMTQLCSSHSALLSHAISGSSALRNGEAEELDVNTSIGNYYETYVILCLAEPWKLDTSNETQQEKMKTSLDNLWKDVEEIKRTFVLGNKPDSGILARDNQRCTLQSLSDQLLELSIFVRSCIDLGKDSKSGWFSMKK